MDPTTPYIDAKTLAEHLRVHPQTIYILARTNAIPHLRVGGQLRFVLSEVQEALSTKPSTGEASS